MDALRTLSLLINGLTLALALSFVLILLWADARSELHQFFAVFMLMVTLWNGGSLLTQALLLVDPESVLLNPALGLLEVGFTGASIAIYALTAALVKVGTRRFRTLSFAALAVLLVYRILLIVSATPIPITRLADDTLTYQASGVVGLFYLLFDGGALVLLWQYRRKLRSVSTRLGIILFVGAQALGFLNPELQTFSLSIIIGAVAALILSFAFARTQIVRPLAERNSQVEAIRDVIGSMTSLAALDTVLQQVTTQATGLLNADAAAIFLQRGDHLTLETGYQLPPTYVGAVIPIGEGVVGKAVKTRQSIGLDDYARDWKGAEDLPLARATFGSVIATPLLYGGSTIGAILVIAGRQGRLFDRADLNLLQLLAAQAAVAITQSRLFGEQDALTQAVEAARSQLETVLTSTDSPVIAVGRDLRLIFANPAAMSLFHAEGVGGADVRALLPATAFPHDLRAMVGAVRRVRGYTYEAEFGERIFLCHLAALGSPRIEGWVAVLNDITQLKELDRMKSEMVRMTSHDLKNPLQAAMVNLDRLRDDLEDGDVADTHEAIAIVDKQLQRMHRIIRGILDMEKMKSGASALEHIAPARIIEEAVDEMRDLALDSGITLHATTDVTLPTLACNREQFTRAIVNLIENAIKFTPRGGEVRVFARQDENAVIFAVEDTGVGIGEEAQARVFDRYYRANQKGVEHITGTGLGLSLVKTIVDNHGGTVWLESREGEGTTVFVLMPVARAELKRTGV